MPAVGFVRGVQGRGRALECRVLCVDGAHVCCRPTPWPCTKASEAATEAG